MTTKKKVNERKNAEQIKDNPPAGHLNRKDDRTPCPHCGTAFTRYVHTLESGQDIYVCAGCGAE